MAKKLHIVNVTWETGARNDRAHIYYYYTSKAKAMADIKSRKEAKHYDTAPEFKRCWYSSDEIY